MKVAKLTDSRPGMPLLDIAVLYVEDDRTFRDALAHMLARRLSKVYTAEDGSAGLEAFKAYRPALVITDVLMPNMDGCAMCREIRAIDPEVPIIMISAHNDTAQLLASIDLGVVKYLVKPIKPAELFQSIEAVMDVIGKRHALEMELLKIQSTLSSVEHDTAMFQDYVARSMGDNLERFGNIRLHHVPKDVMSGDFFSAASHRGDLYLLLADVSGQGISAMAPAMGIPRRFREYVEEGYSLLEIAGEINSTLRNYGLTGHLVAATLVRLACGGHCIEVLNCGNPPALLIGQEGGLLREFHSNTFALGMVDSDDMSIDIERLELESKAALYLFSDGLMDTLKQSRLDDEGIRKIFIETNLDEVFDQVVRQTDAALRLGQSDDITVAEILIDQLAVASYAALAVPGPFPLQHLTWEEQKKKVKEYQRVVGGR